MKEFICFSHGQSWDNYKHSGFSEAVSTFTLEGFFPLEKKICRTCFCLRKNTSCRIIIHQEFLGIQIKFRTKPGKDLLIALSRFEKCVKTLPLCMHLCTCTTRDSVRLGCLNVFMLILTPNTSSLWFRCFAFSCKEKVKHRDLRICPQYPFQTGKDKMILRNPFRFNGEKLDH